MKKVELFGMNTTVEFEENQKTFIDAETGYEIYTTTDGRWIAFDEAVCDWVQIRG